MTRRAISTPRRAQLVWLSLLAIGVGAVLVTNIALALHIERAREQDFRLYLAEAAGYIEDGDLGAAAATVEQALERAPSQAEPYVLLGHIKFRLRHWEAAVTAYRSAIERGSLDAGVRINMVWCLIELERYDDALTYGQTQLRERHSNPLLLRYLGEAEFRAGRPEEAIRYLRAALEFAPDDLYLLERLHQALAAVEGGAEESTGIQERIDKVRVHVEQLGASPP